MKKRHLLSLIFIVSIIGSFQTIAQTTGDYRSNAATFNWDATASWQRWNGTTWVSNPTQGYPGQNATGIAGTVTIQAGHTVTANVDVTTNDIGNLIITGTLTENNSNYDIDMTGNLTITGTYDINGDNCTVDVGGNLTISGGGILNMDDNDIRISIVGSASITGTGAFNLTDDDATVNIGGTFGISGNGVLNMDGNGDDQDITVIGNFTMDGASQVLGDDANSVLQIGNPSTNPATATFTVPATATNARIGGITFTVQSTTTVTGTLTLNDDDGVKTFRGRVTVTGSWTSTAITTTDHLIFGGEVITSGVFACGCN